MIVAAMLIALGAAAANAFAVVLQAAEDRHSPLGNGGRISLLIGLAHRPRWIAGTGLMIIAWPLQVVALALAPITLVQPVLSTSQLVLLAVARVRLSEQVGRLEAVGALAIVLGVSLVVWSGPRHTLAHVSATRVALPLALVGGLAVGTYVFGRLRPWLSIALVVGAALSYAWVDFANKLLANSLSAGHVGRGVVWLVAILGFGALAFLEETTALQRRPAVTVAPVIGAIHDPLPVLMALWSGVAVWGADPHRIAPLIVGLAVIAAGAAILGRSKAVARISAGAEESTEAAQVGWRGPVVGTTGPRPRGWPQARGGDNRPRPASASAATGR